MLIPLTTALSIDLANPKQKSRAHQPLTEIAVGYYNVHYCRTSFKCECESIIITASFKIYCNCKVCYFHIRPCTTLMQTQYYKTQCSRKCWNAITFLKPVLRPIRTLSKVAQIKFDCTAFCLVIDASCCTMHVSI